MASSAGIGMTPPRVVFVTRKYPPSVGGMQTYAGEISRSLDRLPVRPTLVTLGGSQIHLLWFLPYAGVRAALSLLRRGSTRILCGDALVYVALYPILRFHPDVGVVVHGRDMTFPLRLYQRAVRRVLPRATRVLANSEASASVARELGVDAGRIRVLNPGLSAPDASTLDRERSRAELRRLLKLEEGSFIMLTLGRLVARKGVAWFIETVVSKLPSGAVYLVAGAGPAADEVRASWEAAGRPTSVRLLGAVDHRQRELMLQGSDLFVMPNIPVAGDMEGFGLVAIESTLRGTPVLASRLEGIQDAVLEGVTGFTSPAHDAGAFAERICGFMADRAALRNRAEDFRREAQERFSADRMVADLAQVFGLSGR